MRVLLSLMLIICQLTLAQKSEVRSLERFTALKVSSGIDVKLTKGEKPVVRIEASGIRLDEVVTEVQGNTLKISFRNLRIDGRNDVKVQLTYVELNRISVMAASSVYATDPVQADGLELYASAAGSIEIPVKTERLAAEASTASSIILSGSTVELHVDASTSSSIDAYQLDAQRVSAAASTASDIRVKVSREIKAEASTAGSIRYKGEPDRSDTSATTAGSIRKVN